MENLRRKAVIRDGLIEFLDHFFDASISRRRRLHDDGVAAAVGDDVHFLAGLVELEPES